MKRLALLTAAAAAALIMSTPAYPQMVGGAGANAGQSPQDAREMDQTFDDLKDRGVLDKAKADPAKELELGAALVKEEKYADALPHLEAALEKRPNDVTTLTYLGFSHRMIGAQLRGIAATDSYLKALDYYRRGLAIDPKNKLLHEYTGKIYLLLHDVPSAQGELKILQSLCPSGCVELQALSSVVPAQAPPAGN